MQMKTTTKQKELLHRETKEGEKSQKRTRGGGKHGEYTVSMVLVEFITEGCEEFI